MRGKIVSIALLISILASTFAFIAPAYAVPASLRAPTIANPYMVPGQSFTVDILVDDVTQMYKYEFTLAYDTNILTATGFTVPRVKGGPNFPFSSYTIDDTAGTVVASANTDNNTASVSPYFAPLITTTDVLPVAFIDFTIDARGFSALDLQGVKLYNRYMVQILPVLQIDGSFDNSFQGLIEAPTVKNTTLTAGSVVDFEITVDDVSKLWGFQFSLGYDTNVLTATSWTPLSIFTLKAPSYAPGDDPLWDDSTGFVRVAANSFFGDTVGLTTSDPVAIAKISFTVDTEGWSLLDLYDEVLATTTGVTLVVDVHDGLFVSIDVANVKKAWPDTYWFFRWWQPDPIDTLHARITTAATGQPVTVWAVFSVYSWKYGVKLGEIVSGTATVGPSSQVDVTADFNVNDWGTKWYLVWITAQAYYDINGDGIADGAGPKTKTFFILVW